MSNRSNDQGRAYEFACLNALYYALSEIRKTDIIHNSSFEANRRAWDSLDADTKNTYISSAEAVIETLIELEPKMEENSPDVLTLEFQKDSEGIEGDVRDIVVKRKETSWEIGYSVKHNHDAVKHSRLSHGLDFGREWYGIPCSDEYWKDISPIFERLEAEKKKKTKWSDLANKEETVYIPLLNAFIDEIKCAYKKDSTLPRKMVEYLIGIKDYYKVISKDSKRLTLVETFNMHGTLNEPGETKISAITVPVVELPTRMVALELKPNSSTTAEMYLDNGWEISFRIHNASTMVEPSLKFDIGFMGMPGSILQIVCSWK